MITSKRDLKKHISDINDAVVKYVLPSAVLTGIVSDEQAEELLAKLATLHGEVIKRLNIAFDKKPAAFPSVNQYNKAKRAYFGQAYDKALAEYKTGVNGLLEVVNKAAKK